MTTLVKEGNTFGYLLQKGYQGFEDEKVFFGIGSDKNGVPVDVAGLHLIGNLFGDFLFLLTDTFPALNGESPVAIAEGLQYMQEALKRLNKVFEPVPLMQCSGFFDLPEYRQLFEQIKNRILASAERYPIRNRRGELMMTDLKSATREAIPQDKRRKDNTIDYPIHEYACTGFLGNQGFRMKVGQDREKLYDEVMRHLFPEINFVHMKKVYDLSPEPHEVTPYAAKPGEVRIMLTDKEDEVVAKLECTNNKVLRYLATLGAIAGDVSGRSYVEPKRIVGMQGNRLRDAASSMVIENILVPYKKQGE